MARLSVGEIGAVLYLFDRLSPGARRSACQGADSTGHMGLIEKSRISRYEGQRLATAEHSLPGDPPAELCAEGRWSDAEDLPKSSRHGRVGQTMPSRPVLQTELRITCQFPRQFVRPVQQA